MRFWKRARFKSPVFLRSVVADGQPLAVLCSCWSIIALEAPAKVKRLVHSPEACILPRRGQQPTSHHGTTRGLGRFAGGFSCPAMVERTPVRGESNVEMGMSVSSIAIETVLYEIHYKSPTGLRHRPYRIRPSDYPPPSLHPLLKHQILPP